jgi:hypothetical protein
MHLKCVKVKHNSFILRSVYRQFQKNSCNEINFTDIPFRFMLHKQILKDIIKAEYMFTYIVRTNTLFFVSFLCLWLLPFVSLSFPQ